MQKALVGCLLVAILGAPALAAENRHSIGGGVLAGRVEVDNGAEIDTSGGFVTYRMTARRGALLMFTLSATSGDDTTGANLGTTTVSAKVEDDFLRVGMTAGYMFFQDKTFRLFLHGGFAYLGSKEQINGVDSVDDSSFAASVGGGIEVGKGHHAIYLNVGFDYQHDVAYIVPFSIGNANGRSEFNLLELQVGYVYNF